MIPELLELLRRSLEAIAWVCFVALLTMLAVGATFTILAATGLCVELRRYSGAIPVICPKTGRFARVHLRNWRAAMSSLMRGEPDLCIRQCSLWPEHHTCDRSCTHVIRELDR